MKRQPEIKSETRQLNLFVDERSLFEKLCDRSGPEAGFKAVKKNGGSPGTDGVAIQDFESRPEEEPVRLPGEIGSRTYKPNPARRAEMSKPGKGAGVRLSGVPCVRDGVVRLCLQVPTNEAAKIFRLIFSGQTICPRNRKSGGLERRAQKKGVTP
jgi:hypothetical protein